MCYGRGGGVGRGLGDGVDLGAAVAVGVAVAVAVLAVAVAVGVGEGPPWPQSGNLKEPMRVCQLRRAGSPSVWLGSLARVPKSAVVRGIDAHRAVVAPAMAWPATAIKQL